MTPEEELLAAADDMAKYGHNKETYFASALEWETAPSCAYGSLARATGQVGGAKYWPGRVDKGIWHSDAAKKLADQIRKTHPFSFGLICDTYRVITTYNDDEATTGEDVILMMKEAAHG